jgi:hypothetical protein
MSINGDPKPERPESKDKVGESFTLPNKDEMLARLIAVDDNSHLQQKFYPRLLKNAGTVKVPMGVVMMLTLAIHDLHGGNASHDGWHPFNASIRFH